ncbi:cytochrome P450 [Cystobasidium minutum MCA 4210]|uniref:cytochrome P450 n=1 Tax=Cystobasidium minutum MCA 4210 TaxID=1397322 RepID=UPI0034CF593C|eukprot:jgi/Rhomi1/47484/CE47483_205
MQSMRRERFTRNTSLCSTSDRSRQDSLHFEYNSVYALFPFQTPMSMRKLLTQQGTASLYNFNKPMAQKLWKPITRAQDAVDALRDHTTFLTIYEDKIEPLSMKKYGFFLAFDGKEKHDQDRKMTNDAIWPPGYDDEFRLFYTKTVQKLIKEHSYKIPGSHTYVLDVVRDVGNLASVYWVATYFGIPLKTQKTPLGIMTPQELYMAVAAMFAYIFMDSFDPTGSFKLKAAAEKAANTIGRLIEARIKEIQGFSGPLELLIRGSASLVRPGPEALAMYKRLIGSGRSMEAMVSSCLGVITAAVTTQGQAFAQSLNVFMMPEHREAFDNMQAIASVTARDTDDMFLKYSWEGQRLDPVAPGLPRVARTDTSATGPDGQRMDIRAGDKVWISMTDLNNNPDIWTNPELFDVNRKPNKYTLFSVGMHNCLGSKTANISQPVLIREVMKLKNLRRAPGKAGTLNRFSTNIYGSKTNMYFTPTYEVFPFPTTMTIMYDV